MYEYTVVTKTTPITERYTQNTHFRRKTVYAMERANTVGTKRMDMLDYLG